MPIIKSKILKRTEKEIVAITREQLELDILKSFDNNMDDSQKERSMNDEINTVDRGMLLTIDGIDYCSIELDPGEIYGPPVAGTIAEAWKQGIIKSSEVDKRLKPYKRIFKRN